MLVDVENQFSDAQAITATAPSTNVIDLSDTIRDIGTGENLYVVTLLDIAMTDAGSDSTVQVDLQKDTVEGFGSPELGQTLFTFAAISAPPLAKFARIQPDAADQRFLRLNYVVAGGSLTTGSFTSFITKDIQKWRAYFTSIKVS